MKLKDAVVGNNYCIENVLTNDEELRSFLFTLGCYQGESISVISKKKNTLVVSIKDGRYSIDTYLADAIMLAS